ncbi:Alpha/Beta hydrolase protein [Radiomyces spectabilis]|uniref:Alpha/Beta hydrolase protein n=1 Tax=Radiomyces spectabilis TaxID=64574 RepID=UPI00221F1B83|nr:Alpha/Beta hydrolase protein [Radiomyces spectabilis]KAI8384805.1 Alpha/Beta hydrolase protein [Radiomyces spectabilis]
MVRLESTSTHIIPCHRASDGCDVQKLAVDQHVFPAPKSTQQRLAFLWGHSNGFHKESLHPFMRRFLNHLRQQPQYDNTELVFVTWDARHHGDSARLNEGTFFETCTWFDSALDVLQVVEALELKSDKYNALIGVGHSFGGTCMLLCEFFYPKTFDGLTLIEPVMSSQFYDTELRLQIPVLSSRTRRDTWQSREECLKSLTTRKFWKRFDPEVLENYVQYGLYDAPDGTVKLKCPREQEYHVFRHSHYPTRTAFNSLAILKVPVQFVYALGSTFMPPEEADMVPGQNRTMIRLDFVEGSHMVPNEKPDLIVPHIDNLLTRVLLNSKKDQRIAKL